MSQVIVCPACGKRYPWHSQWQGKRVKCPCGKSFRVQAKTIANMAETAAAHHHLGSEDQLSPASQLFVMLLLLGLSGAVLLLGAVLTWKGCAGGLAASDAAVPDDQAAGRVAERIPKHQSEPEAEPSVEVPPPPATNSPEASFPPELDDQASLGKPPPSEERDDEVVPSDDESYGRSQSVEDAEHRATARELRPAERRDIESIREQVDARRERLERRWHGDLPYDVLRTGKAGGDGGGDYLLIEEQRRPVVGFHFVEDDFGGPVLYDLAPVYDRDDPLAESDEVVLAKPDYAVSGIVVDADKYVRAVKIIFARHAGNELDVQDTYESAWLGQPAGNPPQTLGNEGKLILGTYGGQGLILDSVGLVTAVE